jgi:hypothetical protein
LAVCGALAFWFTGPVSHGQEPESNSVRETAALHPGLAAFLPPAAPQAPLLEAVQEPVVEVEACRSAWLDHPRYRPAPRPGYFSILPTGCGYYSLRDVLAGETREAPPKSGYPAFALMPPSLFDADFRYVDDPKYNPDFLEQLHRIHLGDNWLFGTGGQAWWRHMHEYSSRFTGKTNDYDLVRVRIFGDLWYKDTFRIYAELISANTYNQDLPPLRIDEDRIDFQNLFLDIKVGEIDGRPVYVRAGRQELLFGSQRLISPPDWANTRRTFQGVRGFWSNDKLDIDLFWVQPVLPNNTGWSSVDDLQNFYGAWATYHPEKKQAIDLYYLFLDNANRTTSSGLVTAPTHVHTIGTRYNGDKEGFLWDFEGMLQLGDRGGAPITAGAATAGLGYNAKNLPMNPTVWGYYDWASGDHSPNSGSYTTFNQLFPFGHYYFGWLDLIGRQNIRDWNAHLYLYPAKWITFNAQYHLFNLDSARDALYGVAGTPTRVSLNGTAGGFVGQELDLIFNFHLSKRTDFMVGYSKLNVGEFISNTGNGRSPELFFMMYNVRW